MTVIVLVCLGLEVLGDQGRELLRYDRAALGHWQIWRLVTGHFIHLGWAHAAMNLIALGLLAALYRRLLTLGDWIAVGSAAIAAIDAGLYWASPDVDWYVGLSGMLHGVGIAGAVLLSIQGARSGILVGALIVTKVLYEQLFGPVPLTAAGVEGAVIVEAHFYGVLGGLLGLGLLRVVPWRSGAPL